MTTSPTEPRRREGLDTLSPNPPARISARDVVITWQAPKHRKATQS